MAAQGLASTVGVAPACEALGVSLGNVFTVDRGRPPSASSPGQRPLGRFVETSANTSLTCLPHHALLTVRRARWWQHSSMRASTCARSAPCIACWRRINRYESVAINVSTRNTPSPSSWPRHRTRPGHGTSRSCWGRRNGPTSTYVLLDIFSRYVVGWMVADRENSTLAGCLIEESCLKQGVQTQVLTLHSDRGAPMTSKCTAQLLADLGVTRSLSRPQVCDDNPFSEAQFKTLKYHPGFPGRFRGIDHATAHCRSFFPWYNTEHRHGGISMLTRTMFTMV